MTRQLTDGDSRSDMKAMALEHEKATAQNDERLLR